MTLRILICGLEGSPVAEGTGGIERLLVGWSRGLAERGIEVHLVNVGCDAAPALDGVACHAVGSLGEVHPLAADLQVDLLSVHNTPSLALSSPVPTTVCLHNVGAAWVWPRSDPAGSLAGLVEASGVCAVSGFVADRAARVCGREVTVVVPFADDAFFTCRLPEERRQVALYAGRLLRRKGVGLLPEVARRVRAADPSAELLVTAFDHPTVADPEFAAITAELAGAPGIRLVPALRSSHDLADLYASARAVVVPSMCDEAFGLVSVEAQACGAQPVVFADGGLEETLASGRLVPVGAVEHLAAGVIASLQEWSPALSDRIRARARRFSRESSTDAFLGFCSAAMSSV